MIFAPTAIPDVVLVRQERLGDARGWFARTFCAEEFEAAGIAFQVAQANLSANAEAGTLRGMHLQAPPHGEPKLVRASRGRLFDVAVDLRRDSPTFCRWVGAELSGETGDALHIPAGCAHGFLTLSDDVVVSYLMGAPYVPGSERGVRWDDPAFGIDWPSAPQVIAERDRNWPDFDPAVGIE